ncbi:hypothetical protein D3C86_1840160 [compost metagenome]
MRRFRATNGALVTSAPFTSPNDCASCVPGMYTPFSVCPVTISSACSPQAIISGDEEITVPGFAAGVSARTRDFQTINLLAPT